jgi:hypothetical protein
MAQRKFPILGHGRCVGYISWEVAELLRRQAMINHGQTLERLAERGGLSWQEAAVCLANRKCGEINPSDDTAKAMLAGAAHALDRLKEHAHVAP